jgi:glutamine synthetase
MAGHSDAMTVTARAKWEAWDEYRLRVSDYEIERYLETA